MRFPAPPRILLLAFTVIATAAAAGTVTIDLGTTHQVIRGFGGATVYRPTEPLSDGDLDLLFGTAPGQIGFSLLRIRVSTQSDWRELELANALGARARGAAVIATPWSPPAAWKSNNDLVGGRLLPEHYADFAAYLDDFAGWMADQGAPLYAISVQNEPDIEVTYESCDWTPAEMLAFCRDHVGRITSTRVIAPESFQFRKDLSDPLLNDPVTLASVDIIGGHIYGGGLADYPAARAAGKEVWMTEHLELDYDWPDALNTAREMHQCLVDANFSAYLWWYLKRYYGPLGEDSVITKRGYVMSQFARFIRPGYVRVDATPEPAAGVYVSAYQRDQLVIVAVNTGATPVEQTFTLSHGSVATVTPWTTSEAQNAVAGPPLHLSGDTTFTATLPASSVTTFVGERIVAPTAFTAVPADRTVATGAAATFTAQATGEVLAYQWFHDGSPLADATGPQLRLAAVTTADAGDYTVRVSNTGGAVTSAPARLIVSDAATPGRLLNLSTRAVVGRGSDAQIGGFVISGTGAKSMLLRAAGPVLRDDYDLPEAIADPKLELYDQSSGHVVATAVDWDHHLAATFAAVGAFSWPAGSRDAALQRSLDPGVYTAVVSGANDTSGIALLELYDTTPASGDARLTNLSTRSLVQTGNGAQIGGFVIGGETDLTLLIRAAGPELRAGFGLADAIGDPALELYDQATGEAIGSATAWDASLRSVFAELGAFAWSPDSRDAALLVTLPPGAYSVVVRDQDGNPGLSLLEIYVVP